MERYEGTVKWFDSEKGFGFIQVDGDNKDLFVHHSQIKKDGYARVSLQESQRVSFGKGEGLKGEQATDVEII